MKQSEFVEVNSCSDCPFYSEYENSEIYRCLCLLLQRVNESDDKVLRDCPLLKSDYNVYLTAPEPD
jgi:hypothetical protein